MILLIWNDFNLKFGNQYISKKKKINRKNDQILVYEEFEIYQKLDFLEKLILQIKGHHDLVHLETLRKKKIKYQETVEKFRKKKKLLTQKVQYNTNQLTYLNPF